MTDLVDLGAAVEWTDADAASTARQHPSTHSGRLAEFVEWLATTQGRYPPTAPRRPRCVVAGALQPHVLDLAAGAGIGVRTLDAGSDIACAFTLGIAAADEEVDSGSDLLVLAAQDDSCAAAVVVSLLTDIEPVALLPRGSAATDTGRWIEQAVQLRDTRRRARALRDFPDELLGGVASAELALATGFIMRAAARRTALVLDGTTAVAAAVLCRDIQSRSARWWVVADSSPDPVHARAAAHLGQHAVLDLGTDLGDGTAGLLAVQILRTAVATIGATT